MVTDGEDRAKEVGVGEVGAEGLVRGTGLLPRVAAAGEVDEDDAERPDVVVRGRVGPEPLEEAALAFCSSSLTGSSEEERAKGGRTHLDSCRR